MRGGAQSKIRNPQSAIGNRQTGFDGLAIAGWRLSSAIVGRIQRASLKKRVEWI
jgi:hypothetical protein